ncbi:MAG: response regulator [Bacteroidota bacterium]
MNKDRLIMLVDDDVIHNFITEHFLKDNYPPVQVVSFVNPEEALKHLSSIPTNRELKFPDVIFLDINMPLMNGWEFLDEYIKMDFHHVAPSRIYILSSSLDPNDISKAQRYSAVSGFISKPLSPDKVNDILE